MATEYGSARPKRREEKRVSYTDEIEQAFDKSREVVDNVAEQGGRTSTAIAELEALSHALKHSLLVLSRQIEEVARMGSTVSGPSEAALAP